MGKEGNIIITKESPGLLELTKKLVNVAIERVSEGPEDNSGTQRVALDLGSRVYLITKTGAQATNGGLESITSPCGLFISGIQKGREGEPVWQLNGLRLPVHDSSLDSIKEINPKNIEALVEGFSVAPRISVDVYTNLVKELRSQKYKKKPKSRRGRRR